MSKILFQITNALNVTDLIISLNLPLSCHFSKRADPKNEQSQFRVEGTVNNLRKLQASLLEKNLPIGTLVMS